MENTYSLIVAIVNRGFSGVAMDAARQSGAGGGTILNAKGTVAEKARSVLGIAVQPEKELVLIIADKTLRNNIMTAVVKATGLNTPGKGIVFALPVEDVLGIDKAPEATNADSAPNKE